MGSAQGKPSWEGERKAKRVFNLFWEKLKPTDAVRRDESRQEKWDVGGRGLVRILGVIELPFPKHPKLLYSLI